MGVVISFEELDISARDSDGPCARAQARGEAKYSLPRAT